MMHMNYTHDFIIVQWPWSRSPFTRPAMRRWRRGFLRGVEGDGGQYLYVCKVTLKNLRNNLLNGEEISLQDLVQLPYFPVIHRGSLLLTAVDMRYEARGWCCYEQILDEVDDKRLLVQAFHRAQECFAGNEDGIPASDRLPSELTSRDLKKLLDKIPSPASSDVEPSDEDGPLSEVSDLDAPEKLIKDKDILPIRGKGKGNFENENDMPTASILYTVTVYILMPGDVYCILCIHLKYTNIE